MRVRRRTAHAVVAYRGHVRAVGGGPQHGLRGLHGAAGLNSAPSTYALAAVAHAAYGTNEDHFAAVAVSRDWARDNPTAQMRDPITVADHHTSRWVAEPLRLLDCCLVSNGGVAVVVTSAERARDLQQPPVYVWGWGQGHPGYTKERGCEWGLRTGAVQSEPGAFARAGIGPSDIDVAEIYDCFTYTVIVSLEDYGFCEKGEGEPFAASGAMDAADPPHQHRWRPALRFLHVGLHAAVGGRDPGRGQGGGRQAPAHDLVLVSGNGGAVEHHGTLVLGAPPTVRDGVMMPDVVRDDESAPFFDGAAAVCSW